MIGGKKYARTNQESPTSCLPSYVMKGYCSHLEYEILAFMTEAAICKLTNWRQFFMRHNIVKVAWIRKLSNCPLSLADASHELQIYVSVRMLTINIGQ